MMGGEKDVGGPSGVSVRLLGTRPAIRNEDEQ